MKPLTCSMHNPERGSRLPQIIVHLDGMTQAVVRHYPINWPFHWRGICRAISCGELIVANETKPAGLKYNRGSDDRVLKMIMKVLTHSKNEPKRLSVPITEFKFNSFNVPVRCQADPQSRTSGSALRMSQRQSGNLRVVSAVPQQS